MQTNWHNGNETNFDFFQGYVLVYDVTNFESFTTMDKLKKDIDRHKEKKEVSSWHSAHIARFELKTTERNKTLLVFFAGSNNLFREQVRFERKQTSWFQHCQQMGTERKG